MSFVLIAICLLTPDPVTEIPAPAVIEVRAPNPAADTVAFLAEAICP